MDVRKKLFADAEAAKGNKEFRIKLKNGMVLNGFVLGWACCGDEDACIDIGKDGEKADGCCFLSEIESYEIIK